MGLDRGYVQVYTGDGKGKTTAALGLIIRALGAGYAVFLGQFAKRGDYCEIAALKSLSKVALGATLTVEQYGRPRKVGTPFRQEDREAAGKGLKRAKSALVSEDYDLVVLDELNLMIGRDLVSRDDVESLVAAKPCTTELVTTGRYAPEFLLELADLVTDMRPVKHYYKSGVPARLGIER